MAARPHGRFVRDHQLRADDGVVAAGGLGIGQRMVYHRADADIGRSGQGNG